MNEDKARKIARDEIAKAFETFSSGVAYGLMPVVETTANQYRRRRQWAFWRR